jgi:hypothetical protein
MLNKMYKAYVSSCAFDLCAIPLMHSERVSPRTVGTGI